LQAVRADLTDFSFARMENMTIAEITTATPMAIKIDVNI